MMTEATGKIEGDLQVESDYLLRGVVTGSITVGAGGYLELHGMVCRDLNIEPGGIVALHGTIAGDVYNRGGDLEVYGVVVGALHNEGGATVVDPEAVIGRVYGGR